jgi:hypothetical protein
MAANLYLYIVGALLMIGLIWREPYSPWFIAVMVAFWPVAAPIILILGITARK